MTAFPRLSQDFAVVAGLRDRQAKTWRRLGDLASWEKAKMRSPCWKDLFIEEMTQHTSSVWFFWDAIEAEKISRDMPTIAHHPNGRSWCWLLFDEFDWLFSKIGSGHSTPEVLFIVGEVTFCSPHRLYWQRNAGDHKRSRRRRELLKRKPTGHDSCKRCKQLPMGAAESGLLLFLNHVATRGKEDNWTHTGIWSLLMMVSTWGGKLPEIIGVNPISWSLQLPLLLSLA